MATLIDRRLARLERASPVLAKRLEMLVVGVDEDAEEARRRRFPEGVPTNVHLLTIKVV